MDINLNIIKFNKLSIILYTAAVKLHIRETGTTDAHCRETSSYIRLMRTVTRHFRTGCCARIQDAAKMSRKGGTSDGSKKRKSLGVMDVYRYTYEESNVEANGII